MSSRFLTEALRSAYFRLKQSAEGFSDLAREFGSYADQFNRMASQARTHCDRIRRTLQPRLG